MMHQTIVASSSYARSGRYNSVLDQTDDSIADGVHIGFDRIDGGRVPNDDIRADAHILVNDGILNDDIVPNADIGASDFEIF